MRLPAVRVAMETELIGMRPTRVMTGMVPTRVMTGTMLTRAMKVNSLSAQKLPLVLQCLRPNPRRSPWRQIDPI